MHFVLYGRLSAISGFLSAITCVRALRHQIERQPFIDVRDPSGIQLKPFSPNCGYTPSVSLDQVTFAYPSRPDMKALDNISFTAEAGRLTALVGPSGAGKSSIAALLVRQYDPSTANLPHPHDQDGNNERRDHQARLQQSPTTTLAEKGLVHGQSKKPSAEQDTVSGSGIIRLDGTDLCNYNLASLRSCISVVHQEPQLLAGTIFENIAMGLSGTPFAYRKDTEGEDVAKVTSTRLLCIEALKKAEAWEFVQDLPEGLDTLIAGGRNGILSGGQRQRIAIARALVGSPAVLILDEATSALSSDMELKIRNNLAVEQKQRGLTIISIAHRLQCAQLAHKIIVMKQGRVVDTGTYSEISRPGRPDQTFARLVNTGRIYSNKYITNTEEQSKTATSLSSQAESTVSSTSLPLHRTGLTNMTSMKQPSIEKEDSTAMSRTRLLHFLCAKKLPFYLAILFTILNGGLRVVAQLQVGRSSAKLSGAAETLSMGAIALIWLGYAFGWSGIIYGSEVSAGVAQRSTDRRLISASVKSLFSQEISYFEGEAISAGMLTTNLIKHSAIIAETLTVSLSRVSQQESC
jgi:ATP-binding cassette subfamily B (MDR/TAP) protein 1